MCRIRILHDVITLRRQSWAEIGERDGLIVGRVSVLDEDLARVRRRQHERIACQKVRVANVTCTACQKESQATQQRGTVGEKIHSFSVLDRQPEEGNIAAHSSHTQKVLQSIVLGQDM